MFHRLKNFPRQILHASVMTSSIPGLVSQMVSFLGSKNIYCTSFFVDNRSDFTFVHHQFSTFMEDAIKAKNACECYLSKNGKEIRHYHSGNIKCAAAS